MKKNRNTDVFFSFFVLAMLLAGTSNASTLYLFDVHEKYQAPFPGSPSFAGKLGTGNNTVRAYQYIDHEDGLAYSSNATQTRLRFRERDIDTAIENWVKGDLLAVNGKLEEQAIGKVNRLRGAIYRYRYVLGGLPVLKCSAVIYHEEKFVSWNVQGSPGYSRTDPCDVFHGYISYFGPR